MTAPAVRPISASSLRRPWISMCSSLTSRRRLLASRPSCSQAFSAASARPRRRSRSSRIRSEEHTSELQSPDHLVCRLLLENKNRLIDVDYEPLQARMSIEEALAHPEVRVHEYPVVPTPQKKLSLHDVDIRRAAAQSKLRRA